MDKTDNKIKDKEPDTFIGIVDEDEDEAINNINKETFQDVDEDDPPFKTEVFDEDSDNPPAGTPGHPGFDEDAG
jgi:hypothetical protein